MSIRDAFLADICDHPEEDAPRLVFADWLEENNEPDRARFIRIQCESARLDHYDWRRRELVRESRKLLTTFGKRWLKEDGLTRWVPEDSLKHWPPKACYERGFVARAWFVSPDIFLAAAPALARVAPVRHLALHSPYAIDTEEQHRRLDATYHRRCYEILGAALQPQMLTADAEFPDPEEFRRFLASDWFGRLAGFEMDTLYSDRRLLETLLSAPLTAGLRSLDLSGNWALAGESWEPFASATVPSGLRSLKLDKCRLGLTGLRAVARSPALAGLHSLSLEGDTHSRAYAEGFSILRNGSLHALESLRLRGQEAGAEGYTALAIWPGLKRLKRLDLSRNYPFDGVSQSVDPGALASVVRSPHWGEMLELNLDEGSVPDLETLVAVLDSPNLTTLRVLTFRDEWVWSDGRDGLDEAARLLARCPHLADDVMLIVAEANRSEDRVQRLSPKGQQTLIDRFGARLALQPMLEHYRKWDDWAEDD